MLVQFVVTLASQIFSLGPEIRGGSKLNRCLNWAVILVLFFYVLVTVYSSAIAERITIWPYLNGSLIGILILSSATKKKNRSSSLMMLMPALAVSMAVVVLSLLINGPMPIKQDEGRFAGFAYTIIQDGRWTPYATSENAYYQFFHVVPFLQAVLSLIIGQDVIYVVHPIIVLINTLLIGLNIYVILKKNTNARGIVSVLGPILLALTPPISTLGFMPPTLAMALYLSSFLTFIIFGKLNSQIPLILVILISITGVITHALYAILLLTTFIPLFLAESNTKPSFEKRLLRSVTFVVSLLTLIYWVHTFIINMILSVGIAWTDNLIELITGEVKPFETTRPVWYFRAPIELACSWTLLPALTSAYIVTQAVPRLASLTNFKKTIKDLVLDRSFTLGLIGILLLGTALLLKATPWGPTRYFYPFYLLLIPASSLVIGKIADKKRIISITLIVIMISTTAFYAVQDPAVSPDIHKVMMLANKRSWTVAESLAQHASPNLRYRVEPRVGIGFEALIVKFISKSTVKSDGLLILNYDELGKLWATGRFEEATLQAIENGEYEIVFSDGSYKAYYIRQSRRI